jgi:hypothetical protein
MNIGIRTEFESTSFEYYKQNYDIVRTPDFDEKTRILKPQHGLKKLGPSYKKKCRFCGRDESEVKFRKVAHAFPECIGNKALETNYECDSCNDFFGKTIENDYGVFFNFFHSIMQINGKNGVPECKFKIPCKKRTDECMKYCIQISKQDDNPCIRYCQEVPKQYIILEENRAIISQPVGKFCPIAIFKTLVKMAITVMPYEELSIFQNTIKWLLEEKHRNFYKNGRLLVRFRRIPGFNVVEYPEYYLYRRKKTVWNQPYMLFSMTYGCYSLFIEIPKNELENNEKSFLNMPFPPIRYYHDGESIWDMSSEKQERGFSHQMVLNFRKAEDCSEQYYVDDDGKIISK